MLDLHCLEDMRDGKEKRHVSAVNAKKTIRKRAEALLVPAESMINVFSVRFLLPSFPTHKTSTVFVRQRTREDISRKVT